MIHIKKQNRFPFADVALATAFVFVFGVVIGIFTYFDNNAVASVVSIDVNRGVELKLNKNEDVISATAFNADGESVIGTTELKGMSVEVALNALIGSMIRNGCIDDIANSVLISVECDDAIKNNGLRKEIMDVIHSLFSAVSVAGSVITQTVDRTDINAEQISKQYDISFGKAQLVAALCKENASYDPAFLAELNINELVLLVTGNGTEVKGEISGSAGDKAYINASRAQTVALNYSGVTEDQVVGRIDVSLDFDNGFMVYEVNFRTEDTEYDIEINALNGDVVSCETEEVFSVNSNPALEKDYVFPETVADIVTSYCSDRSKWLGYECEFDHEDGMLVYEVEVKYDGVKHEFIVNAVDGTVLRHKTDRHTNGGINIRHKMLNYYKPTE